jgi:hypothetical protein
VLGGFRLKIVLMGKFPPVLIYGTNCFLGVYGEAWSKVYFRRRKATEEGLPLATPPPEVSRNKKNEQCQFWTLVYLETITWR